MSKANKQQVPKIRFEGFLNSWEKSSLDSYVKVVSGGTPDTKIKEYWGGDINWFAPAEIGNQRYVVSSERKITETGLKNSSAKLLPAHKTVLFTSRAGIGSMALLSVEACTNQGFQSLVVNTDKAATYFIYSMGKIITQSALKIASGSTFLEISGKALAGLQFNFPKIEEQTQIGNFFQQLDKLIELQTRAVESAETYKKAMLQKMFPQKGEKVPRVRFEGFSEGWKKAKLEEVADIYDGTHQTPKYTQHGIKFLSVENILTLESDKYISPEDFYRDFKIYPQRNDILMTRIGSVGVVNIVQHDNLLAYYVSLALLKAKGYISSLFLLSCIRSSGVQKEIWRRTLHIAFPKKINKGEIGKINIFFPEEEEQIKIGNFFQKLDQNIESEKKKLEQYQTMKRAMLQRMFV